MIRILSHQVMTQLELRQKAALSKASVENLRFAQAVSTSDNGVLITEAAAMSSGVKTF